MKKRENERIKEVYCNNMQLQKDARYETGYRISEIKRRRVRLNATVCNYNNMQMQM
jgi:hypothetical protein